MPVLLAGTAFMPYLPAMTTKMMSHEIFGSEQLDDQIPPESMLQPRLLVTEEPSATGHTMGVGGTFKDLAKRVLKY